MKDDVPEWYYWKAEQQISKEKVYFQGWGLNFFLPIPPPVGNKSADVPRTRAESESAPVRSVYGGDQGYAEYGKLQCYLLSMMVPKRSEQRRVKRFATEAS